MKHLLPQNALKNLELWLAAMRVHEDVQRFLWLLGFNVQRLAFWALDTTAAAVFRPACPALSARAKAAHK